MPNSIRAAVTGFAKTIANEAAPFGVTVNCVLPGYTRTERLVDLAEAVSRRTGGSVQEAYASWEREVPMGRLGEPDEVAGLVAYLVSEEAAFMTGANLAINGGQHMS